MNLHTRENINRFLEAAVPQEESLGGRGGSVLPFKHVPACVPSGTSIPEPEGRYKQELADALLRLGIWVTRRELRDRVAATVIDNGFSVERVVPILEHTMAMAGSVGIGAGECVNLLRDPVRMKHAIEDWEKRRGWAQTSPGEAIRQGNMLAARCLEQEWQEFVTAKAAGKLPEPDRRPMPWER